MRRSSTTTCERAFALLLLSGCTLPSVARIDPPPADGAASMVILVRSGDELRLFARSVDAPGLRLPFLLEEGTIDVFLYDRPLEALALSEGPLTLDPNSPPLPRPDRAFQSRLEEGALADWAEAEPEPELLAKGVARTAECTVFEPSHRSLGTWQRAIFALRVEPDVALVGTHDDRLFRVDSSTVVEVTAPAPLRAGYRDETGELWFIDGDEGHVLRGRWTGETVTVERAVTATSSRDIDWMLVDRRSDPPAIFGMSRKTVFYAIDPVTGEFTGLSDFNEGTNAASLVLGPEGDVFAAADAEPIVLRYADGELFAERVEASNSDVGVVGAFPQLGIVAGSRTGQLLFRNAVGDWKVAAALPFPFRIRALPPWRRGFLVSDETEAVSEYIPGFGLCPSQQVGAGREGLGVAVALESFALLAPNFDRDPSDGPTPITLIRAQ